MLVTRNPTSNTSPDPGQGGVAVTGNGNTGHGSTTASQTAAGTQTKTCIWEGFVNVGGQRSAVNLKFTYSEDGSIADVSNLFKVEYSINGGSGWLTAISHADVIAPDTQSVTVALSATQDISQVKVRDLLSATSTGDPGGASVTASVSDIRVEATTVDDVVVSGGM